MTKKEALSILKPTAATAEALKAAYRAAALKYHPDHGGDAELMKLVNAAYDALKNTSWTPYEGRSAAKETPLTETMAAMFEQIRRFHGVNIEMIGTWLWVSGGTRRYKEQLKDLGFKWSRNKTAWYYHEDKGYRKKSRRRFSMDDIRQSFGFKDLETDPDDALSYA